MKYIYIISLLCFGAFGVSAQDSSDDWVRTTAQKIENCLTAKEDDVDMNMCFALIGTPPACDDATTNSLIGCMANGTDVINKYHHKALTAAANVEQRTEIQKAQNLWEEFVTVQCDAPLAGLGSLSGSERMGLAGCYRSFARSRAEYYLNWRCFGISNGSCVKNWVEYEVID